ncbi:5178_t:CDS:1, partial [Dentiscutata heterogama]
LQLDIVLAIALFISNILQVVYKHAKIYESTCKQNLLYLSTSISILYSTYASSNTPIRFSSLLVTSKLAIDKLTE